LKTGYRADHPILKGLILSAIDPGLRRVSVHADTAVVDLALPAGMPVAGLIPSIVDMLDGHDGDTFGDPVAKHYQLSLPGASALPASTTLAQNGIRDGAVLVLSQPSIALPAPRYDDVAEGVSATIDAISLPWNRRATQLTSAVAAGCLTGIGGLALIRNALNSSGARNLGTTAAVAALAGLFALVAAVIAHRAYRDPIAGLTLNLVATAFAAVAGFLAVPGGPGGPNVLLAAMAAAVMSVFAMRVTGCGVVTLTAIACFAMVIAAATLVAVITEAALHTIGSVCALISFGVLGLAGRMSIVLSGLSPQLPPAPHLDSADRLAAKAIRADGWLASLLAAFASSAAVGAVVTAFAGASRIGSIAFAAIIGALLLLRTRHDRRRTLVFAVTGIITTGASFAVAAASAPGPLIAAATATLAAVSVYLGFVAPAMSFSPVVRRSVELLELLALVAMVPLTCWICGLYDAVRGLNPN
jgi:type VII secretion integral membrane protein EccD